MKKIKNEEYDDRTKQLMELRNYSETQFDKQIIYLSAGALMLSIGFVKDIVINEPQCKCILVFSWFLFSFALGSNLISHIFSRNAADEEIKGNDKSQCYDKITRLLNDFSLYFFIAGLIFMLIFATKNFL